MEPSVVYPRPAVRMVVLCARRALFGTFNICVIVCTAGIGFGVATGRLLLTTVFGRSVSEVIHRNFSSPTQGLYCQGERALFSSVDKFPSCLFKPIEPDLRGDPEWYFCAGHIFYVWCWCVQILKVLKPFSLLMCARI